ncbi:MAG TPA: insulinase family protein [Fimbriimonadales bacterium]|nr:insulinase family protein [Fimbriimonadales bacterium]
MSTIHFVTLFSTLEILRLSNGIPVLVQKDASSEYLVVQAVVRTSNLPPSEIVGMEILAEAMIQETQNITPQRLSALTYLLGGNAHVFYKDGAIVFEIVTIPSYYSTAIGVLSEVLLYQDFSEENLRVASEKVQRRHRILNSDPIRSLLSRFRMALNIEFSPPSSLNEAYAKSLYFKNFHPGQIAFSIVGNISSEAIAKRLNQSFGYWKSSVSFNSSISSSGTPPRMNKRQTSTRPQEGDDTTQFHLSAVAVSGPPVSSAEFPAWLVVMNAIGGGKSSRMQSNIRYKMAWAYASGVTFSFRHDKSWAIFYCLFRKTSDSLEKARKRTEELEKLITSSKNGFTEEETERAVRYTAGCYIAGESNPYDSSSFGSGHHSASEKAFWVAWWELEGAGARMDTLFLEKIDSLTKEDLNKSIRKWVNNPSTFTY